MAPSSPSPASNAAPRYHHAPPRNGQDGLRVVTAAARCGLVLDPWQRDVIYDSLSRDATGLWLTPRVAVSVPRQNGKGAIIEALEVAFLLGAFPEAELLIHSAHEFKTAQNGFQRLASFFEAVPDLAKAVDQGRVKIGTAAAREFVTVTGADGVSRTVRFMARSKGSGRGFSADILILDEAQELSDDVWAAVLPTISARPNAQIWLFGTPPAPSMNGEVFTRLRAAGIEGIDSRLAYFEWSAEKDAPDDDPITWALANPAFGLRIREASIRDEYGSMDEDTFGRERLGRWDGVVSYGVIPEDTWNALRSELVPQGKIAVAIDVSPDRSRASVALAGYTVTDKLQVEVVDNRRGTGWVVDVVRRLTEKHPYSVIIIDSGGPAASLVPDFKKARIRRVELISTREVGQACGAFYDAAMQERLRHVDQPALNEALAAARKRPLGDSWAWHRKSPTADITPLVAATFAAFGLATHRSAAHGPSRVLVL